MTSRLKQGDRIANTWFVLRQMVLEVCTYCLYAVRSVTRLQLCHVSCLRYS